MNIWKILKNENFNIINNPRSQIKSVFWTVESTPTAVDFVFTKILRFIIGFGFGLLQILWLLMDLFMLFIYRRLVFTHNLWKILRSVNKIPQIRVIRWDSVGGISKHPYIWNILKFELCFDEKSVTSRYNHYLYRYQSSWKYQNNTHVEMT